MRGDNLVRSDKMIDCFIFILMKWTRHPLAFRWTTTMMCSFLIELCSIWSLIHKVRLFSNWANWSSSFIKSKDKPSTYTKCLHHLSAKSEADILSTSLKAAFILQVFLCDNSLSNSHTLNSLKKTSHVLQLHSLLTDSWRAWLFPIHCWPPTDSHCLQVEQAPSYAPASYLSLSLKRQQMLLLY